MGLKNLFVEKLDELWALKYDDLENKMVMSMLEVPPIQPLFFILNFVFLDPGPVIVTHYVANLLNQTFDTGDTIKKLKGDVTRVHQRAEVTKKELSKVKANLVKAKAN